MEEAAAVVAALQSVAEVVDGSTAGCRLLVCRPSQGLAEFITIRKVLEGMGKCPTTNVLQRQKEKKKIKIKRSERGASM